MLRIYDISRDEYREATQADIDQLTAAAQAYGHLRTSLKLEMEKAHEIATWKTVKETA